VQVARKIVFSQLVLFIDRMMHQDLKNDVISAHIFPMDAITNKSIFIFCGSSMFVNPQHSAIRAD
jgi:hypothetical protein